MKIVEQSLHRPVTIIICTIGLIVFGLYGLQQIGIERMPNVDIPIVMVRTKMEGASPSIVDNDVTDKLESRINTIEGIKNISSSSYEGRSFISVEFVLERNIDNAAADVRGKASMAQSDLPDEADNAQVDKYSIDDRPVMAIAIENDGRASQQTVSRYIDKVALERLQTVEGVGGAEASGYQERQIRVWVDTDKLEAHDLTAMEVKNAITSKHVELPAGRIETGTQEYGVRLEGEYASVEELAELPIKVKNSAVTRLKDVARIEDGFEDMRTTSMYKGKMTPLIQIRKQRGANEVGLSNGMQKRIAELNQIAPPGIQLRIVQDNARFIRASMSGVANDIIWGVVLTAIIMFLFLRTIRATFVTVITIPVCLFSSLIVLWGLGMTLNNMSTMGISLAVGMVVDATTVVIENVQRHREMGKSAYRATMDGASEVGPSVIAGAATTIAVFLPVALMPGMIGRFFNSFGVTVTVTIAISLLLSVTLTPFLCSRLMGHRSAPARYEHYMELPLIWMENGYTHSLKFCVHHRIFTLLIGAATFIVGMFFATKLGSEFFPSEDQGQFRIAVEMAADTSIEKTTDFMSELSQLIEKDPRVAYTFGNVGGGAGSAVYKGNLNVVLVPRSQRPSAMIMLREYRQKLAAFKDVDLKLGNWGNSDITLIVQGPTTEELADLGDKIKKELHDNPRGLADIVTDLQMNKPRINLKLNRGLADDLGINIKDLSSELEAWFSGVKSGSFNEGGYRYDIRLRAEQNGRNEPDKVLNTLVRTSSGKLIHADGVVLPSIGMSPNVIKRYNRQRSIQIQANVDGISPGEGIAIMEEVFHKLAPQDGTFTMLPAGDTEQMKESFGYILTGIIFAAVLVYMVMAIQFESFLHPLTVMLSLPLMTAGTFGMLLMMHLRINVMSLMGIILLIGIVVNNAIMMVDFANQLRAQGDDKVTAMCKAGPMRLRAILMTTVSTLIGAVPVALGLSEGGETRQPMSAGVFGGLFTSTLLTLFVIPVVYLIFDDASDWMRSKLRRWSAYRRLKEIERAKTVKV